MDISVQVLNFVALATLTGVVLVLFVFLIIRWFWLWYWRVDEQVELLRHIAKHIQLLEERDRAWPPPPAPPGWTPPADRMPTATG